MNSTKRIAIKLNQKAEVILKKGHPWIFSESIVKCPEDARTGDVAVVFAQRDNKLIGVGLYDAESPIRVKILSANKPVKLDTEFFKERINAASERRKEYQSAVTNAYRLVYGESDGLPGVIVDVYAAVAVLKLYSGIWLPYLDLLTAELVAELQPAALLLRLSRNVAKEAGDDLEGKILHGSLPDPVVTFKEYDVVFQANVVDGHKTGYFLDHRSNRHQVGMMARGMTVLDVFAYAGGFSVHALAGGARSVTSVDISEQALATAKANAALNTFKGQHVTVAGDAFDVLKEMAAAGRKFDIVVIDPPSFAKQRSEVARALKQYERLAGLGIALCAPKGVLVLASCSSRVSLEDFLMSHKRAFGRAGQKNRLIKATQHDWDHPIGIPESAYLKTAYYQL